MHHPYKTDKRWKAIGLAWLLGLIFLMGGPVGAQAQSIQGILDYDAAQRLFHLANASRQAAGLPPLAYDHGMAGSAAQRAAEVSVKLSHRRPDGTVTAYAENFSSTWQTAEGAHRSFMGSQAHRANILHPSYRSMAAAVFYRGNKPYWLQLFSSSAPSQSTGLTSGQVSIAPVVTVLDQAPGLTGPFDDSMEIEVGGYILAQGAGPNGQLLQGQWTSSNPAIATVSPDGKITGISPGAVVLTVDFGHDQKRIKVVVAGGASQVAPTAAPTLAPTAAPTPAPTAAPSPAATPPPTTGTSFSTSPSTTTPSSASIPSGALCLPGDQDCADGRTCSPLRGIRPPSERMTEATRELGKLADSCAVGGLPCAGARQFRAAQKRLWASIAFFSAAALMVLLKYRVR